MSRSRRGRGEGSIYRRKDGRWCASVRFGRVSGGPLRRRTVYGASKAEVQKKLARLSAKAVADGLTDAGKQQVRKFLTDWLELVRPNLKRSTMADYDRIVNDHLVPYFDTVKIEGVSIGIVEACYASIKSVWNRRLAHAVLRRAFRYAVRSGAMPSNPCHFVDAPKPPKRQQTTLSVEDVLKLMKHSDGTRYHAVLVLAVLTGLRQGELFALHLADWNRKAGTLHVQRSLSEVGGHHELEDTKTEGSRRLVTLPQMATDALVAHLKFSMAAGSDYLFTSPKGKPLRKANFQKAFYKPLFEKAGVGYVRFHNLRHTMASLLLQAGVHPKVVQERLGHGSIQITMDLYSHSVPSLQREASDKLQQMFGT